MHVSVSERKLQVTSVTMVHGKRQSFAFPIDAVYCHGTQLLIQEPFAGDGIQVVNQFDGVNNDRYIYRLYHKGSGDLCGLAPHFKV